MKKFETYKGKLITELSREELIEALQKVGALYLQTVEESIRSFNLFARLYKNEKEITR
uniref:Uncharacterized protein n=1 Tax=viral metagenome TaxID=1070528 RepID=A0A6M3IH26_9ZZZZ